MDEDHPEAGGLPGGQGDNDADFIEAGEIAAEYEVRRFSSAERAAMLLLLVSVLTYCVCWYNMLAVAVLTKPSA